MKTVTEHLYVEKHLLPAMMTDNTSNTEHIEQCIEQCMDAVVIQFAYRIIEEREPKLICRYLHNYHNYIYIYARHE